MVGNRQNKGIPICAARLLVDSDEFDVQLGEVVNRASRQLSKRNSSVLDWN